MDYHCCICKASMPSEGPQAHTLDPCALIIVAHIDREWRDRKEQDFYCHFECFRRVVGDEGILYIMEPDFSTNGEVEDEQTEEASRPSTSPPSTPDETVTVQYDPEADAAYVRFSNKTVSQTQEQSDVCILDLDAAGGLVGIELLSVFGFAGAALSELVGKGVVTREDANHALQELKRKLVAASAAPAVGGCRG